MKSHEIWCFSMVKSPWILHDPWTSVPRCNTTATTKWRCPRVCRPCRCARCPCRAPGSACSGSNDSGIPMDWWETTPWSTDWDLIWLVFTKKDNSSSPIDFDGQIDGMGPRPPYRRLVAEMSLWLSGGFDLDFHGGIQQQQWTHIGIWVVAASFFKIFLIISTGFISYGCGSK